MVVILPEKSRQSRMTSDEIRYLAWLFTQGKTNRQVSAILGRSVSCVRYWKAKLSQITPSDGSEIKRPARKTPALIKKRRALAVKLAGLTVTRGGKTRPLYPTASMIVQALQTRFKIKTSKWTVMRDLRASGYACRVRKYWPSSSAADFQRRARFARGILRGRHFPRCMFSDEKVFTTNDFTGRTMWVKKGSRALGRENTRFPPRVMVWAAISKGYLNYYIIKNKLKANERDEDDRRLSSVTSDNYRRCILPRVVPYILKKRLTFQQDGAKPHTAKATKKYLAGKKVKTLDWPARSPDLNPIENFWALLASRVAQEFPQTCDDLRLAIDKAFAFYQTPEGMKTVNSLVASFKSRCQKVAKNQGRY